MNLHNPNVRAIAAGLAAALVALSAAIASQEGVNAAEWVTIALSFLAGAGLTQAVDARRELVATRNLLVQRIGRTEAETFEVNQETLSRLGEIQSGLAGLETRLNQGEIRG